MQVSDAKAELAVPSAYPQATLPVGTTPAAGFDQTPQFQLPPELLADWPWPFDSSNSEGFFPLAFE
jgi:hypothetical protein